MKRKRPAGHPGNSFSHNYGTADLALDSGAAFAIESRPSAGVKNQCQENRSLPYLSADFENLDHLKEPCPLLIFYPGLRERASTLPLGLFPEGQHFSGSGEDRPSGKMTSAAYTAIRDSVAEVTAVGCQARFFQ